MSTEVATAAEVHETMQHDGMVHMMPRAALVIPAGGTVSMAPGGLHVMLVGLRRGLSAGDSVPLRIHFSDSTQIRVVVPVHTP
jgi:copper(I)-binding protein